MSLSRRDKIYTLIGILLALFLGALDQTIVATALPQIVEDLNGLSRYDWVVTSYLLASTVLVPIYGKLADMYSRKAIELWAVGLFLAGSFLCGIAGEFGNLPLLGDGMSQLIAFRALQGMGGAGLFAMAFIIIADLFPPSERGRYQGLVGAAFGIASVLGPLVGGFLTDQGSGLIPGVAGWRWVFYVNVPFGALALWFIVKRMPPLRPQGEKSKLNYLSAFLLIAGLVPLVLALRLDKTSFPWLGWVTISLFAVGVVMMTLFTLRSLRVKNPILDFSLFRNRVFTTANIALFFLGAAFLSTLIFLPLFMVNVVGISATGAGASLIPLSMGLVFGSIVSGQLVSRFGHYRLLMLSGLVILFVAVLLLSQMTVDVGYWTVIVYLAFCGLGLGPSMPLYTLAIQNAVDPRKIGQATSASQFFRQMGGVIGVAIMGTVLVTTLSSTFSEGQGATASTTQQTAAAPPFEVENISSGGLEAIEKQVGAQFEQQYQAIAETVRSGDQEALAALLAASPMPEEARAGILRGAAAVAANPQMLEPFLARLEQGFHAQAESLTASLKQTLREAFTTAITRIFGYALFLIAAGWLVTLLIPELPLRKTLDHPVAAAAD